jgi:hypothetical protein
VTTRDVQAQCLATSTALTRIYVPDFITPLDVARVLDRVCVQFVLVGTHAFGGWMNKPRACDEVEVLPLPPISSAVYALQEAFPALAAETDDKVTRLRPGNSALGCIAVWHVCDSLARAAVANGKVVQVDGHNLKISSLELGLAVTFDGMRDSGRDWSDRYQSAHDFLAMIHANSEINFDDLANYEQLVSGKIGRVAAEVRRIRSGRKLEF